MNRDPELCVGVARVSGIPVQGEQASVGRMIDEDAIWQRWEAFGLQLNERGRRLFVAGEVRTTGWGGLAVVSKLLLFGVS
jgi:hypothetical protein